MASESAIVEQRLMDLKEKNDKLDKVIRKLSLDIIKVESKLLKKQAQCQEKMAIVEKAQKTLEEA